MNLALHLWFGVGPIILTFVFYLYFRFEEKSGVGIKNSKEMLGLLIFAEAWAFAIIAYLEWMQDYLHLEINLLQNEGFLYAGVLITGFFMGAMMLYTMRKSSEVVCGESR